MTTSANSRRRGFTVLETVLALGVLGTAAVLVAQTATWAMLERSRTEERLAAVETVANVLEAARARPWTDLTPEWAAGVRLPDDLAARLKDAALTVRVEPDPARPRVKRVTAELNWIHRDRGRARTASLTGLFADRSAGGGS